jgi:hypothetical protein
VSADEEATYVPRLLDGSLHIPQRDDAYVHVRLTKPVTMQKAAVTAYLPDGTALVVFGRDLVRLAPADDLGKT